MSRCPFAIWRPLPEAFDGSSHGQRLVIFHTMVGTLAGTENYFKNSTGIESHFGVGCDRCKSAGITSKDGEIWQWVDTHHSADANQNANDIAISVETCDHYTGGTYTNPPLSPGQIDAWIQLGLWAAEEHGVAKQLAPDCDGPGMGYHSQMGAPSCWTPSAGKTCPNPTRIAQFKDIVLPAIISGETDMAITDADAEKIAQTIQDKYLKRLAQFLSGATNSVYTADTVGSQPPYDKIIKAWQETYGVRLAQWGAGKTNSVYNVDSVQTSPPAFYTPQEIADAVVAALPLSPTLEDIRKTIVEQIEMVTAVRQMD
jgi:hypothetical protein